MARALIQSMAIPSNTPAKNKVDSMLMNARVRPKKFAQLLAAILTTDEPTSGGMPRIKVLWTNATLPRGTERRP